MLPEALLPRILFLFGIGFLAANVKFLVDWLRFRVRKRSALLIWQAPKPKFYGLCLAMALMLGLLVMFKLGYQQRPLSHVFGEAMMFVYYGYAVPLSTRIGRGFYEDGIWADSGFMRYRQITGISWREHGGAPAREDATTHTPLRPEALGQPDMPGHVTLLLVSRLKSLAERLEVPANLYGQARKLLRDKIKAHDIQLEAGGLVLGAHDERDSV